MHIVALETLGRYNLKSVNDVQKAAICPLLASNLCGIVSQVYDLRDLQERQIDGGNVSFDKTNHVAIEVSVLNLCQ